LPRPRDDFFASFKPVGQRILEDFFDESEAFPPFEASPMRSDFVPCIDILSTPELFVLLAELPGISEHDVEILVSGDYLTIKGKKASTSTHKSASQLLNERSFVEFERVVRLPADLQKNEIVAQFADGLLTVEIPKSPKAKALIRKIAIKH
jgi:HSP20 family protein